MCCCLNTLYLCIWFINFELTANSAITHTWARLTQHHKHIIAFVHLGTLQSTLALWFGAIWDSEIAPAQGYKCKENSSNYTPSRELATIQALKQEARAVCLLCLWLGPCRMSNWKLAPFCVLVSFYWPTCLPLTGDWPLPYWPSIKTISPRHRHRSIWWRQFFLSFCVPSWL